MNKTVIGVDMQFYMWGWLWAGVLIEVYVNAGRKSISIIYTLD